MNVDVVKPSSISAKRVCMYFAMLLLQENSAASDVYEHIRDDSSRYDAQTMDAATESQRQMMQMTELDNVNDHNADDDVDKPTVPAEIESDIIQVIFIFCLSYRRHRRHYVLGLSAHAYVHAWAETFSD